MKIKLLFSVLIFFNLQFLYAYDIKWQDDLEDAKELAVHFKKPIFLFLESRKCYYCSIMKEKTFTDEKVIEYIDKNFIPVILDNGTGAESDVEGTGYAPERLTTSMTPAIYFMGPNEEKLNKKGKKHMLIYGMWTAKEMLEWLKDAKRKFIKMYGDKYE
jgi:hypothetical protein